MAKLGIKIPGYSFVLTGQTSSCNDKPLRGSIRDVKALKNAINKVLKRKCILVLDRGPASYIIPEMLNENEIGFVLPLKRNFVIIDYT